MESRVLSRQYNHSCGANAGVVYDVSRSLTISGLVVSRKSNCNLNSSSKQFPLRPVLGTHPIERPKEYVSAWKEKDQFSAVIITLAVTENIGSAAIPTSNLLTAATQNLGLYAGSLRVLSQADAENPAEQNGFLQSHALYSTVKQMSFLQHAGTSTPFSNRPPVFVQLGDILAAGYRKYKSKIDCFVGMAQGLAMDAAISMLTGGIGAPAVIYRRARAFCRMFATVKEQWDDIQVPVFNLKQKHAV